MSEPSGQVDKVVRGVLEDITGRPVESIGLQERLVDDLQASSDDLSFVFVPTVQRELGVVIRPEGWRRVYTVQDAIDLLTAALAER